MTKMDYITIAALSLIGVTLFSFGQPKERLAAHWAQMGRQAEQARDYKEAFDHYRKAETFADDPSATHPELRAALLEKLGDMALLNGETKAARQYFASAYEAWQSLPNGTTHMNRLLEKARHAYGVVS